MAGEQLKKKVGRPPSEFKTQFRQVNIGDGIIKWQCIHCAMQYGPKTSTANFKRHLQKNHEEYINGTVLAKPNKAELVKPACFAPSHTVVSNASSSGQFPFCNIPATITYTPTITWATATTSAPQMTNLPMWNPRNLMASSQKPVASSMMDNRPRQSFVHQQPPSNNLQIQNPVQIPFQAPLGYTQSHPEQWHPNWSTGSHIPPKMPYYPINDGHPSVNPQRDKLTTDSNGHFRWTSQSPVQVPDQLKSGQSDVPISTGQELVITNRENGRSEFTSYGQTTDDRIYSPKMLGGELSNGLLAYVQTGTKRKCCRDIEVSDEDGGLELFTYAKIEELILEGFSKCEILEKMLSMTVCNPMYLHAFLNDGMHEFFHIVHPQFPNLSLNLINDEMLCHKRESLKSILKEFCDTRWSPLLFDVFVFPLVLGENDSYAIVELVYLDKKGHRRSCLLDCIPIPDKFPEEILCGIISRNLREFEVDSMLCDCTMWGRQFEVSNLMLRQKLECRRRRRGDNFWEEEKKKQFFSVLKKTQEEEFYKIQMEVAQCMSCLDQLEEMLKDRMMRPVMGVRPNYGVDMKTIFTDLLSIFEPSSFQYDESNDALERSLTPNFEITEWFLSIVYRKFNCLRKKMEKLKGLGGNLKRKLNQISCDRKYAVYYIQKNQKNINLLHIIPITSYGETLNEICHFLKSFMELLQNPMSDSPYGMSDLENDMDLIEIEDSPELSCNTDTLFEPNTLIQNILKIFQNWRKIFLQGVSVSREYYSLCNYFTGYKNHESNIQSRYAKEFCDVARSAPPQLSPEKWKKVAFLRAWNKFQSNYYN